MLKGSKYFIIMRGIPGCGKSTLAQQLEKDAQDLGMTTVICSTDSFFMVEGVYKFDQKLLGPNHEKNRAKAKYYIGEGYDVIIIDNTNLTTKEVEPYCEMGLDAGYIVRLIVPPRLLEMTPEELVAANVHGVPLVSIQRMISRMESNLEIGEKLEEKFKCTYDDLTESLWHDLYK
jgi:predicted kinase